MSLEQAILGLAVVCGLAEASSSSGDSEQRVCDTLEFLEANIGIQEEDLEGIDEVLRAVASEWGLALEEHL